jgi:hypothetical protein
MRSTTQSVSVVEFSTEFRPEANVTTNNSSQPGIFRYPPTKTVTRAPWKRSVRSLYELHKSLYAVAVSHRLEPVDLRQRDFAELVRDGARRDNEYQVAAGHMRRVNQNTYALTLKGVILAVPVIWLNMAHGLLSSFRRSDDSLRQRLRKRLQRAGFAAS